MGIIMFIFRFFFLMMCFRVINNVLRVVLKKNGLKKNDNVTKQNEYGSSNQDAGQDIKTESKPVLEMVKDELCGIHVQKEKAYIVVDNNDKRHYFCSWECRNKFISVSSNIKK